MMSSLKIKINNHLVLGLVFFAFSHIVNAQLVQEADFGQNPGNLEMSIYIPDTNLTHNLPLVVALHGCSQNSESMAKQSGWNELADKYGFAVLYPDQRRVNNGSNCFNWFELEDIEKGNGEVQSIVNMIDFTIENYQIDTHAIFVYGLSAGAAMGVALLAVYPAYFKAGAIFAGGAYKSATTKGEGLRAIMKVVDRTPEEWGALVHQSEVARFPRLIICHGEKDKTVDLQNSYELIEQWRALHHLDTIPNLVEPKFDAHDLVERITYTDSLGKEQVVFYKVQNLGHKLPVDPGAGEKQGGKTGVFAKDIGFFSTYYIALDFGLIP